jgi:hypothetical protein
VIGAEEMATQPALGGCVSRDGSRALHVSIADYRIAVWV